MKKLCEKLCKCVIPDKQYTVNKQTAHYQLLTSLTPSDSWFGCFNTQVKQHSDAGRTQVTEEYLFVLYLHLQQSASQTTVDSHQDSQQGRERHSAPKVIQLLLNLHAVLIWAA